MKKGGKAKLGLPPPTESINYSAARGSRHGKMPPPLLLSSRWGLMASLLFLLLLLLQPRTTWASASASAQSISPTRSGEGKIPKSAQESSASLPERNFLLGVCKYFPGSGWHYTVQCLCRISRILLPWAGRSGIMGYILSCCGRWV